MMQVANVALLALEAARLAQELTARLATALQTGQEEARVEDLGERFKKVNEKIQAQP
jgi:hypothetical protein